MIQKFQIASGLALAFLGVPAAWGQIAPNTLGSSLARAQLIGISIGRADRFQVNGEAIPSSVKAVAVSTPKPSEVLEIQVAFRPSSEKAFQDFVAQVSKPGSPLYKHWLTPEQVGQRFGAPAADVEGITKYLKSYGIKVTLVAKNRLVVCGLATVTQAEKAFQTKILNYKGLDHNGKSIDFHANSQPIYLPKKLSRNVLLVGGLSNLKRPHPATTLTPANAQGLYGIAGSLSSGTAGQGMSIGYANWDGYDINNAISFVNYFGLPYPAGGPASNINIVDVTPGQNHSGTLGAEEGDLDMQMELETVPLAEIYIYDEVDLSDALGVYTRMANDNICGTLSESYGWYNFDNNYATACDNEHLTMAAQGQTYMCSSGDYGTAGVNTFTWPASDMNITVVGGTQATVDSNNNRVSEYSWSGSGGGWIPVPLGAPDFNVLPSWQTGPGIPTNINFRLFPDVGMQAWDTNNSAFYIYFQGVLGAVAGTSCSSPWFTGGLTILEQNLIANGQPGRLGNINPMIYSEQGRPDVWYAITQGPSNGSLPNGQISNPTTGWDFITGWGAPNFDAWFNALSTKYAVPTGFTVFPGHWISGTLQSLSNIDNDYLQMQPGPTLSSRANPLQLEVDSTSPVQNASNFEFDYTAHGDASTVEIIELFNFSTGQYDVHTSVNASPTDQTIKLTAPNASNYIQSGTGLVRARISYYASGPTAGWPWNEYANQAIWVITP